MKGTEAASEGPLSSFSVIGGTLVATCLPSLLCLRVVVCVEIDCKLVSLHTRGPSIPMPHKQMFSSLQGCARCKLLQGTKCKAWVRMPPSSSQPSLHIEPYGHCPHLPPPMLQLQPCTAGQILRSWPPRNFRLLSTQQLSAQ